MEKDKSGHIDRKEIDNKARKILVTGGAGFIGSNQ